MKNLLRIPEQFKIVADDEDMVKVVWCGDADIDGENICQNVPMEGFVLDEAEGGIGYEKYHYAVKDPRGFSLELDSFALAYMLVNADITDGKIDGKFIYGWEQRVLNNEYSQHSSPVLIPLSAPDYKMHAAYSEYANKGAELTEKDLKIGATYVNKYNQEMVFLGKFPKYVCSYSWIDDKGKKHTNKYWQRIPIKFRPPIETCQKISIKGENYAFACLDPMPRHSDEERTFTLDTYGDFSDAELVWCMDDGPSPYLDQAVEALKTKSWEYPIDYSKCVWVLYSKEMFEDFCENIKIHGGDLYYKYSQVFSDNDMLDGYTRYTISFNRISDMWEVKCSTSRFAYTTDLVTINIVETIDELYDWLRPQYRKLYLTSGAFYGFECATEDLTISDEMCRK